MQELVRQKNKVEVKLNQQLQETKKELEKERETFRAELNEREARERALEVSKRQLEAQLTAVDRENYESLQELGLLQERLQERIRVESELREEKNKLLNVIKEKEGELVKERSELTDRLQQHEQVIEVNIIRVILSGVLLRFLAGDHLGFAPRQLSASSHPLWQTEIGQMLKQQRKFLFTAFQSTLCLALNKNPGRSRVSESLRHRVEI